MDVVGLVAASGGTATRAQLAPCRRAELDAALRDGSLVRLARGVYALPTAPAPLQAAAALRGVVSHASAAQLWFLELVEAPERPHVTVGRSRSSVTDSGAVQLHWSALAPADVRSGVTSPLRTLVDCARSMPFPEALAVADSALRRRLVTRGELRVAADGCRGAGRRAVVRVAGAADGRAANPFESALRGIVLDAGLAGFHPQLRLSARAFAVRVDLGDPGLRIALEADGFAWHGDRAALARDCRRYDELVSRGWLVLRFAWEQVMFEPEWVREVVLATCRRRERELAAAGGRRRRPPGMQKSA